MSLSDSDAEENERFILYALLYLNTANYLNFNPHFDMNGFNSGTMYREIRCPKFQNDEVVLFLRKSKRGL